MRGRISQGHSTATHLIRQNARKPSHPKMCDRPGRTSPPQEGREVTLWPSVHALHANFKVALIPAAPASASRRKRLQGSRRGAAKCSPRSATSTRVSARGRPAPVLAARISGSPIRKSILHARWPPQSEPPRSSDSDSPSMRSNCWAGRRNRWRPRCSVCFCLPPRACADVRQRGGNRGMPKASRRGHRCGRRPRRRRRRTLRRPAPVRRQASSGVWPEVVAEGEPRSCGRSPAP